MLSRLTRQPIMTSTLPHPRVVADVNCYSLCGPIAYNSKHVGTFVCHSVYTQSAGLLGTISNFNPLKLKRERERVMNGIRRVETAG
jgi:hypothetical protein